MSLSFSTYIFLTRIKLFIRHPVVFSASWFYQSSLMALCSSCHGVFLKTDSYILWLATMSPCKGDTPIFVDNKGWTWEPASSMTLLVFIYVYRINMNIERLMTCSKKNNLHLKNILSSNNKSKQQSTFKSKQQSMTSCRCKYNAQYNL